MNKLLVLVALAACGDPPASAPPLPPVPEKPEVLIDAPVYAQLEGGTAVYAGELDFALGEQYPSRISVTPTGLVYVAASGCRYERQPPAARWTSMTVANGAGAEVALAGGALDVRLVGEGTVTVRLEGELVRANCKVNGVEVPVLPLRQTLTLRVRRIGGFEVRHPARWWPGCSGETMVMPAGELFPLPAALPIDARGGEAFEAANAPVPIEVKLRAEGLAQRDGRWRLDGPGRVEVVLDTELPVRGTRAFVVVGPEALTSVSGKLMLYLAATKETLGLELQDGKSYPLYFPDQENTAAFAPSGSVSSEGAVCAPLPGRWFSAASSTPETCAVQQPGVAIVAPGECRFEVTVPGTSFRWAAAFSTTR